MIEITNKKYWELHSELIDSAFDAVDQKEGFEKVRELSLLLIDFWITQFYSNELSKIQPIFKSYEKFIKWTMTKSKKDKQSTIGTLGNRNLILTNLWVTKYKIERAVDIWEISDFTSGLDAILLNEKVATQHEVDEVIDSFRKHYMNG